MTFGSAGRAIALALLFSCVSACEGGNQAGGGGAETDAGAATEAVEGMMTALQNAFVAKDAARIADLFAPDAVLVLPDGRTVTGRDSIEARIAGYLPTILGYSIASQRLRVSGDLAHDLQAFQLTLPGVADGERPTVAGHQMVVLQRDDSGEWKIVHGGIWLAQPAGHAGMAH